MNAMPDLSTDQLAEKVRTVMGPRGYYTGTRDWREADTALVTILARLAKAEQMAERFGASAEARLVEKRAAEAEREKWLTWSGGNYPDDSPGDVIAAYIDGTIILDDSVATWNPLRALAFSLARLAEAEKEAGELRALTAYDIRDVKRRAEDAEARLAGAEKRAVFWRDEADLHLAERDRLQHIIDRLKADYARFVPILAERHQQDEKWGEQNHDPGVWATILGEEYGEVCQAVLEAEFSNSENPDADLRKELIEVAAVAVAWLECIARAALSDGGGT